MKEDFILRAKALVIEQEEILFDIIEVTLTFSLSGIKCQPLCQGSESFPKKLRM